MKTTKVEQEFVLWLQNSQSISKSTPKFSCMGYFIEVNQFRRSGKFNEKLSIVPRRSLNKVDMYCNELCYSVIANSMILHILQYNTILLYDLV